ncbi:MAG: pyruvate:ferredoxin (flavodoxin) oxidoreductase [Chloroflexi bacterium]|nr:pyruvate:ferredoxin (flavodoxin) oxidoreductase [Chloroflexota bacterium]
MNRPKITITGNQAVASVAYKLNEVIAIYPITPSSPMGEWADQWYAEGIPNIWGTVPTVIEMQSEGGAAGTVHGALQTGALSTTFTSSQGLLLMIPNMFKIAGELTSTVFHVAARSVASQALSIFCDHSDVMATRSTGFALLASGSVQEAMDFALIAQVSTLSSRIPFLHFFDGFRTSHEVVKVEQLLDKDLRDMLEQELVQAHRERGLSPDSPFIRGTAQNPDVFFQARETVNPYYLACPEIVQAMMDKFANLTERQYELFEYLGAKDAKRVIVLMGSGTETAQETVEYLTAQGEDVGLLKVRLYRPFSVEHFIQSLPASVKSIAVLDRTKEPGSTGEPLYLDVVTAVSEAMFGQRAAFKRYPRIIGGRYGLSSKEFTPAMVKAVLDELSKEQPKNHFTIGIEDDVTHTSLNYDPGFSCEDKNTVRAVFYGLGSDGTVGANENSIKIIGEGTDNYAQGYFVYDSKKAGSGTVSHLRFGPNPIRSTYLISQANFVACHQFNFLQRIDVLSAALPGATFLLNSPYAPDEVWDYLPKQVQQQIVHKKLRFYVVDGYLVAKEVGLGRKINTIMQACFFSLSGVLPEAEAISKIKQFIEKSYGKLGEKIVQRNFAAVDRALDHLHEVKVPKTITSDFDILPPVPDGAPDFVREVLGRMISGKGDQIPVSALPDDGTYPTGTTQWEKRNLALEIPVWKEDICVQCGKCVFVCPHAAIREKVFDPALLVDAPKSFKSAPAKWKEFDDMVYTLQIAPEDCTECKLCVEVCPVMIKLQAGRAIWLPSGPKAVNMAPLKPLREQEIENWEFFLSLPEIDRTLINLDSLKNTQLLQPLFEFSGACVGCGETPYLKLLTQLFGDRTIIANATGCSSIYGGNLPTTPWAINQDGRGPAWSNSLFEDNAEFGLGMRLALDKQAEFAMELVRTFEKEISQDLANELLYADQSNERGIKMQRERVQKLKGILEDINSPMAKDLLGLADILVRKSVWIVGGDGWAYDIGFGGLDHVLASGRDVNILVLDTEVYSNTGGQASKATPRAAVAKFATEGRDAPKKDLGLMAMSYGKVYVAQIAMGASDKQTLKAFLEAEAYDGPSLIIAYSHCIAHGYDMTHGLGQQKLAVDSGSWPLYRFDPRLTLLGKNPMQIDSLEPTIEFEEYAYNQNRYSVLLKSNPERAEKLMLKANKDNKERWDLYRKMAAIGENDRPTEQGDEKSQ